MSLSVIIPAWNAARWIPEAVASVRRQAVVPDEILVVDDASSDGTAQVAARLGPDIGVLRHSTNRGPAAARNTGIQACRGEWISFLDADDVWPPNKLLLHGEALRRNTGHGVCLGMQRQFREPTIARNGVPAEFSEPSYFIFLFGCGLFHRDVVHQVGPIDESMRHGEDSDWFFRLWEQRHRILLLPQVTLFYRRHAGGMTHNKTMAEMGHLKAMRKSLARRRAGGEGELPDSIDRPKPEDAFRWLTHARRRAGDRTWTWDEWLRG